MLLDLTPEQFAALAARALAPKPPPRWSASRTCTRRRSASPSSCSLVRNHLAGPGRRRFRALTADCEHTLEVVARFLALLELYRQQRGGLRAADAAGGAARAVDRRAVPTPEDDDVGGDADDVSAEHLDEEYS